MVASDFSPEVEIRPFLACVMHPAIILGTVRSFWTWLWGTYHARFTERISSLVSILMQLNNETDL